MNNRSSMLTTFLQISISVALFVMISRWFTPQPAATPDAVTSGQKIEITAQDVAQPLNKIVTFAPGETAAAPELTTVETKRATYVFSNHGAVLTQFTSKQSPGSIAHPFATLPKNLLPERGMFLVALEHNTPYLFDLVSVDKKNLQTTLIYQAKTTEGTLTKTFTLYDDTYQIDLTIDLSPAPEHTMQPRIMMPAPELQEATYNAATQGIVYTARHHLETIDPYTTTTNAWSLPTLIGATERYFVHTLVADHHNKATRGYFITDGKSVTTCVEGKKTDTPYTWRTSWYCGPKELSALNAVDKRLSTLLEFGWFALPARAILWLMELLYTGVKNYGLAIILLALIMKLALLPFTTRGEKSMKSIGEFQKKLQYLETKFKNDPERLKLEKEEFIRKHGLPKGAHTGCLLMFIQIPVFIALNRVLSNSLELYQAPFLWIADLSAKDPYYIFPAITALSIMGMQPAQQDPRQKTASFVMALVIAGVIAHFAAGLTLSIAVSTLAALLQTLIMKRLKRA